MSAARRRLLAAVAALSFLGGSPALSHPHDPAPPREFADGPADVQIALLLDTSNSMDGLIHQARTQLWTIVNEFSRCKRDGRVPRVSVALYEYGNTRIPAGEGHVRQVLPLTTDLDRVSEALFGLTTSGGDEYCGQVIRSAVDGLNWRSDPRCYKAIFVAGNEPFTQGRVDYREAIAAAMGRGVVVNTIHCGPMQSGIEGMWADGAKRGEGSYMSIDQDRARVAIVAPQDELILKLNVELNATYLPYGAEGRGGAARQVAQDAMAAAPAAAEAGADVSRAVAKASSNYRNADWDFVDAVREGKVKLDDADDAQLPEAVRARPAGERQSYVDELAKRRADVQRQIAEANVAREKHVAEEQRRRNEKEGTETLDTAAVKVVREQMRAKGFETGE